MDILRDFPCVILHFLSWQYNDHCFFLAGIFGIHGVSWWKFSVEKRFSQKLGGVEKKVSM